MGKMKMTELMQALPPEGVESSDESSDSDQEIDSDSDEESDDDAGVANDAERRRIIAEINQAIRNEERIDLAQYPPLYVVHYRGTHFFNQFFDQDERRNIRAEIAAGNFRQPIYSPAVYELANVELGQQLPANLREIIARINDSFTAMENRAPRGLFWAGNKRQHVNYLYQHYQRFVNTYEEFRRESEALRGRQRCYCLLPSRKNPYVATADDPRHAIFYALGGKSELDAGSLRPGYRPENCRAKHPKVGYVQTILHTLPEFIQQRPLMLSSLHAYNAIDIDNRLLNERETSFRTYIPQANVAATQIVRFPSFNVDYRHNYHERKYGIAQKSSFTRFRNNFVNFDADATPNMQTTLMDTIVARYSSQLEEQAKQLVRERDGLLVYLDLDGKLRRNLPTTDAISAQRQVSKRAGVMDTPLYENLELMLPRNAPRP